MDQTPCGPNSPFRLVNEMGGHILFLGCGLNPNMDRLQLTGQFF